MKEASEVFKSIRYAKVAQRDKPHKSTDNEEHGTVGEKEYEDQVKHVKKMAGVAEETEYLEEKNAPTNPALWSRAKALARSKFDVYPSAYANGWASKWYKSKGGGWKSVSEEVEQLDEMPGANMDTRAVHSHLKKKGWSLSRTSGGHDVYTHPKAEHHIAVPRHRQLKAPLVKGILKQSEVREETKQVDEGLGKFVAKVINKVTSANKTPLPQKSDRREFETPGKPVKVNESRAKEIAKMAARRQAGMKEQMEPEDSPEKTDTPAKRSLSKTAGMVKDLAKKAKDSKKEKPDTFQPEPELSSQIVKV